MARTKEFDDLTAVTAARDVFWERGYGPTSLAQLMAATGLSKSSLYETYGSKRDLFTRAAENYLDLIITPRLAPLEAPGAGRDELVTYFTDLEAFFTKAPARIARRGCLMLNTAMDLNDLDAEAGQLVSGYRERVFAAFRAAISTLGRADAERRAQILTASQIGLMVTSRLDPAAAAQLAQALADDVRAW
ncbi:TetR/AcrR family transcriptional regulator [Kineosporia sp. NBRC 101731]|uniref:TetR/AcrR family transcriptional regulator n=1 Tax=Kineosporia sp. NBRC 101731 TaxID=3032199 RepID=UPI0024A1A1C6|nr:TetR/AcrR family transcriptional regulator [Kineosporia sp. NBRC 101731]GLY30744.1 TetR family transcriptional regulator [Kineosporia sp. NBRC 101731]